MKKTIATDKGPKAIGPYSQAVDTGSLVFVSGQIPLDPATQQAVTGDIRVQTARVLDNVKAILEAAGLTMDHVVKCGVFLTDLADFPAMNEVYASYFKQPFPARATVQVAALPKGMKVEIDAVASR
jgi:2-iminobutanoate/2-iminopropanoate deaminase